jgi:hypothetical protein
VISTFLSQLQSYFSKYFFIGSFAPMLAFAFINGGLAYLVFDPWRAWADENFLGATITGGVFLMTSISVGIVLCAYVLSALSTFLRQQLEGKWWGSFGNLFVPAQNRRRLALVAAMDEAYKEIADLKAAGQWENNVRAARKVGIADHKGKKYVPASPDPVESILTKLEAQREKNGIVPAADLEDVADQLVERLKTHDAEASPKLDEQQTRLTGLIDYAKAAYYAEGIRGRHARLQNELNSNFSAQEVAPTKMGNIAGTIQSYAMRRYRCNLEIVWSNLLQVLQKNAAAQATLQEAKTQLDFLVACCWLSLTTAAIWSAIFFVVVPSRLGFVATALAGPFIAYLWYRAAAEQYRSFADVAMTMLDMFRFDLLRAMQLRLPSDVEDERYTWEMFDKLVTFGREGNFRYVMGPEQGNKPAEDAAPPSSAPAPAPHADAEDEGKPPKAEK